MEFIKATMKPLFLALPVFTLITSITFFILYNLKYIQENNQNTSKPNPIEKRRCENLLGIYKALKDQPSCDYVKENRNNLAKTTENLKKNHFASE